ncbi:MAG: hypothetical protein H7039_05645 [Bryobacteraceae bacterium]|nr:hypothetical protein [Bryobacteraceae bacterium]
MFRATYLTACVLAVACCGTAPDPEVPLKTDPTATPEYKDAIQELTTRCESAETLVKARKWEAASDLLQGNQPLVSLLLSVPYPAVAAAEAVSDHEDLYGRMLLRNKHYGDARFLFQKTMVRWLSWKPETEETRRRLAKAQAWILECDRNLGR